MTLTIQDSEVRLDSCSPRQQESLGFLLLECCQILKELREYLGKFVELQSPNSPSEDGKSPRTRRIKRLWRGLQWDSSVVNSFQVRITSIITKINALGQGKIEQNVDILVEHDDQQRRLSCSPGLIISEV